jgi:hypothetical protein
MILKRSLAHEELQEEALKSSFNRRSKVTLKNPYF